MNGIDAYSCTMARWKAKQAPDLSLIHYWKNILPGDNIGPWLFSQRELKDTDTARQFLQPLLHNLHDPFLMDDMEKAAGRLVHAIQSKEQIMVYGDYDVDGTTSVALMVRFLQELGLQPEFYIPDRYTEGYGLSQKGIDYALEHQYKLMIALDCGIRSVELSDYARNHGLDLIICDHHNPGPELPKAYAVLDPKKPNCAYPYKELSGCGVGFKLIQGVCQILSLPDSHWEKLLDLLAVSIACDIVEIKGENRILAWHGLKNINEGKRSPGLSTLLPALEKEAPKDPKTGKILPTCTISDLVFMAGPRINAAGRIHNARAAVNLLLSDNPAEADLFKKELEEYNSQRKKLDETITKEALQQIEKQVHKKSQVAYAPHWNKGVVGIVASRLIEESYKPTIVLTLHDGMVTGSARSVEGFDLYDALCSCEYLLEKFGGHKHAAGMSLKPENLDAFILAFEEAVALRIEPEQTELTWTYDMEIQFSDIHPNSLKMLQKLAPFGPGNMQPLFLSREVRNAGGSQTMGQDQNHLKLSLLQGECPYIFFGVGFKLGQRWFEPIKSGKLFDILYSMDMIYSNGRKSIQLNIKDIRLSE